MWVLTPSMFLSFFNFIYCGYGVIGNLVHGIDKHIDNNWIIGIKKNLNLELITWTAYITHYLRNFILRHKISVLE